MIKKEIEGKELKQVLHFRFSFEPRFSEVDKSLFLAPPSVLRHVMYTIVDRYDNERETWSKSRANTLFHCHIVSVHYSVHYMT
jgi:hypothetical protein